MSEWSVVTVIVVLVGLFFTVGKPIWGVLKELQALSIETKRQEKEIDRDIESIKELVKLSQSHENRLANVEDNYAEIRAQTTELLKVTLSHEARIAGLEIKSREKGED